MANRAGTRVVTLKKPVAINDFCHTASVSETSDTLVGVPLTAAKEADRDTEASASNGTAPSVAITKAAVIAGRRANS